MLKLIKRMHKYSHNKKLNKVLVVEKAIDSTYRGKEELYYIDKNESDKESVDAALKKLGLEGTFDIDWVEGKNKPKIDASQISALNCHMGKLTIFISSYLVDESDIEKSSEPVEDEDID